MKKLFNMFWMVALLFAGTIIVPNYETVASEVLNNQITQIESTNSAKNYILGGASASSLSPDTLRKYTGIYGYNVSSNDDISAIRKQIYHIIADNEGDIKNIILSLDIKNAKQPTTWRAGQLETNWGFSNNSDGFYSLNQNNPLSNISYDQFRDTEPINSHNDNQWPYINYDTSNRHKESLMNLERCISDVAAIKTLCESSGIKLTVIIPPLPKTQLEDYNKAEVARLFEKLAEVTEFIDFSASSVSLDRRYFYDDFNFRKAVGDMILARIYEDKDRYIPSDFGIKINKGNVAQIKANLWSVTEVMKGPFSDAAYTRELPVLMYHHFSNDDYKYTIISAEMFERHIKALHDAGYTAILVEDLVDYVYKGIELPKKPILITIDDGYMSNYKVAYPILERYGFKATISAIGIAVEPGTTAVVSDIPFFGEKEMKIMADSGVISIQSHSYDMHKNLEDEPLTRKGVLRLESETGELYKEALSKDYIKSVEVIEGATKKPIVSFAYPFGLNEKLSDAILSEMGAQVTFTVNNGVNVITKGLPQSLLGLKRYNVEGDVLPEDLLRMIGHVQ